MEPVSLSPFDLFLGSALVVGLPLWALRSWRALAAADESERGRQRLRAYRRVLIVQWSLVAFLALHWVLRGHDFAALGLTVPIEREGLGALLVAGALVMLVIGQSRAALRDEETRAQAREAVAPLRMMLPHTDRENALFRRVAWTAGICEEVFYRGYLPWLFALAFAVPEVAAFGLATLVFGLGHAYQGVGGVVKTTLIGAVFAGLTWASGSLLPAMLVHVAVDAVNGRLAYLLISEETSRPADESDQSG